MDKAPWHNKCTLARILGPKVGYEHDYMAWHTKHMYPRLRHLASLKIGSQALNIGCMYFNPCMGHQIKP